MDGDRQFLIVEDEVAGAAGSPVCPNGGVHVYDITGDKNVTRRRSATGTSTTWVLKPDPLVHGARFDIHEDAKVMTIAYYNGGVRVVDLSGLAGIRSGPADDRPGHEASSASTARERQLVVGEDAVDRADGDFYLYGNDIARGLDVYRFDWEAEESATKRQWLTPAEALQRTLAAPQVDASFR